MRSGEIIAAPRLNYLHRGVVSADNRATIMKDNQRLAGSLQAA